MRCLASNRADLVAGIVLLAAGGAHPPENLDGLAVVVDPLATKEYRIDALLRAFFVPTSDPSLWLRPGGPSAGELYRTCEHPLEEWWHGVESPMLVIQGGKDRQRVTVITIPEAAHALPIERPSEVADHVVEWLNEL